MPRRSKADYPPDWPEIALRVKTEAGWQCVRCGHAHEVETGYVLTVHHLDLDPSNSRWWNLLPLCQRCHLRIQSKVILERPWLYEHSEWFAPYVAGYYAHRAGLPEDRAWVMEHLNELLFMRGGAS
jgi:5-methylcytosine-specific restriction endonuclease McrA